MWDARKWISRLWDENEHLDYLHKSLVAGSLRSFPQESRFSKQFYLVKQMIRGLGAEMISPYFQTLNRTTISKMFFVSLVAYFHIFKTSMPKFHSRFSLVHTMQLVSRSSAAAQPLAADIDIGWPSIFPLDTLTTMPRVFVNTIPTYTTCFPEVFTGCIFPHFENNCTPFFWQLPWHVSEFLSGLLEK